MLIPTVPQIGRALLFCFLAIGLSTAAFAVETDESAADSLPASGPVVSSVVHEILYPFARRWQFQAGPVLLNGDKFLKSQGVGIEASYYWRERWSMNAGAYGFSSSPANDAAKLRNRESAPVAHNPSWLAMGSVGYTPVYGKFSIGSTIVRFRWYLDAGVHAAKETTSNRVQSDVVASKLMFGPNLGTGVLLPLSERFNVGLRLVAMLHGRLLAAEDGGRRIFLYGLQAGYRF